MRRVSLHGLKQRQILKCDGNLQLNTKWKRHIVLINMSQALENHLYSNPNTKMITPGAQLKYW